MGPSEEMPRKQARAKMLYARMEKGQHNSVKALIAQAGSTQDRFVTDAVLEKLERGAISTTDVGVLRDLPARDREIVGWMADFLRQYPKDTLLREVLTAQKNVLTVIAQR